MVWEEARSIFHAPLPPTAIIPDARPLDTIGTLTVRRAISRRSHVHSNLAPILLQYPESRYSNKANPALQENSAIGDPLNRLFLSL